MPGPALSASRPEVHPEQSCEDQWVQCMCDNYVGRADTSCPLAPPRLSRRSLLHLCQGVPSFPQLLCYACVNGQPQQSQEGRPGRPPPASSCCEYFQEHCCFDQVFFPSPSNTSQLPPAWLQQPARARNCLCRRAVLQPGGPSGKVACAVAAWSSCLVPGGWFRVTAASARCLPWTLRRSGPPAVVKTRSCVDMSGTCTQTRQCKSTADLLCFCQHVMDFASREQKGNCSKYALIGLFRLCVGLGIRPSQVCLAMFRDLEF